MKAEDALGPTRFRFTHPDDVAKYGDGWYRYSEADLINMSARALVMLEAKLGMPVVTVMNGMRMTSALGDLGASWIGVRNADPELAGEFNEYEPHVLAIVWRAETEDEGKEQAGPPSPGSVQPPAENSAPEPLVTLPILPVAG